MKNLFRNAYDVLRCPHRQPKCYEMTDKERQDAIMRLNRNVWNDPRLTKEDKNVRNNM
jgi:hypothetical protein